MTLQRPSPGGTRGPWPQVTDGIIRNMHLPQSLAPSGGDANGTGSTGILHVEAGTSAHPHAEVRLFPNPGNWTGIPDPRPPPFTPAPAPRSDG